MSYESNLEAINFLKSNETATNIVLNLSDPYNSKLTEYDIKKIMISSDPERLLTKERAEMYLDDKDRLTVDLMKEYTRDDVSDIVGTMAENDSVKISVGPMIKLNGNKEVNDYIDFLRK